jgi:hypothetical protein
VLFWCWEEGLGVWVGDLVGKGYGMEWSSLDPIVGFWTEVTKLEAVLCLSEWRSMKSGGGVDWGGEIKSRELR